MSKSDYPREAEGAKMYRDDGSRAAWYKVVFNGYQVGTKRSKSSKPTYATVQAEKDAIAAVDAWFGDYDLDGGQHA